MLFVAEVFDQRLYHDRADSSESGGGDDDAVQQRAAAVVRAAVLAPDMCAQLLQMAVLRLMKLSPEDLEEWADDGEAFVEAQASSY